MKKVLLVSHNDLDGYGCNIVLEKALGQDFNITYVNVHYDTVDEEVLKGLRSKQYDEIYITDIRVKLETALIIDNEIRNNGANVRLIDHHEKSKYLSQFRWASIHINGRGNEQTSATELLFEILQETEYASNCCDLRDFVVQVKRYDTYLWQTKYNDITPKKLNSLFWTLGFKRFKEGLEKTNYNVKEFIKSYELILILEEEKEAEYIERKLKTLHVATYDDIYVSVVFAERYTSSLGHTILEKYPLVDYVMILSEGNVSLRSRENGINVSDIASKFGGGGHAAAAGFEAKYVDLKGLFLESLNKDFLKVTK